MSIRQLIWIPSVFLFTTLFMVNQIQAAAETKMWSWTFNNSGDYGSNSWKYDNEEGDAAGPTVTNSAYANTNDVNGEDRLQSATPTLWSGGLGIDNNDDSSSSPWHAFSGRYQSGASEWDDMDAMLLSFDRDVTLTSVTMGWHYKDYDFSLLAYTGAGAPSIPNNTTTYSGLLGGGSWELVGNFYNDGTDDGSGSEGGTSTGADKTVDISSVSTTPRSYYLLSVLNPYLGGDANKAGDDFFKLLAVAGKTSEGGTTVPVPATALLLLLGLPWLRRFRV
ncbi:exosortase-dependent surface protein XDP1 [Motiliproteus sp. MSK22-1]|uniref:exosortase-dependent surface protein XDP1 n=1 Tax=Motiliproteus sp. MSK22-1 TaxID=1897630 RepID=UPI00097637BE|nr:exosortase-dependent surface protein XDP1 [Motiliproteus sp. MSK22-1]OMH25693.1 hypothetical protein BGP75_24450 [Motiliproteus sp. MSK22-1]